MTGRWNGSLRRGSLSGQERGAPSPDSAVVAGEVRLMLQHAISGMPEDERTVIVLAYREELTQSEIADRLGWPIGTVKTRPGAPCAGFGDARRRVGACGGRR